VTYSGTSCSRRMITSLLTKFSCDCTHQLNLVSWLMITCLLQHMLTTFSSLIQVCLTGAGCCNVHARAHRSPEEGHRQAQQGQGEEGPTSPSCSSGQIRPRGRPGPPRVSMNHVCVPCLCTMSMYHYVSHLCTTMYHICVPPVYTTSVSMHRVMQSVFSSLSCMMDLCALPVAVRNEVSGGSVSATCAPAHVACFPLA